MIKKVKNTVSWIYFISDFNGEEIVEKFYKKELQKTNQAKVRIVKVINYMSNGKVMIIHLIVGLTKKILLHKISYFSEPYDHSKTI